VQHVFVGDVQGCRAELEALVARAEARFGRGFELWLVGDLVNRGPGNRALLARVRELVEAGRCRYVLGNHEISLLRTALGQRPLGRHDTFQDVLDDPALPDWIDWIRRRPVALTGRIGPRPFAMVHAAVGPDWDLAELERRPRAVEARLGARDPQAAWDLLAAAPGDDPQADDLARLTRCRTVRPDGTWSDEDPARPEEAWHRAWRAAGHGYGVVYGHFAVQGLHVAPGLRGLDTGCVHERPDQPGRLTAWLPDAGRPDPFALPDDGFWQVRARRRYYDERGPLAEALAAG